VDVRTANGRLRELFDAGIALSSELSLDGLLQKLVEAAARLTDARYAALGVIDESGHALERFITTGIDESAREAIGDLPRGRGILGVLIHDARPLRMDRLGDDPRAVGFPPNHPPMTSFLGVPVLMRGIAYGNLYLTAKSGETPFTEEDEEIVSLLAAQAAVAIENARLYQSATRWSRQLETLHEIVRSIVEERDVNRLLTLVCERARELTTARLAFAALVQPDDSLVIVACDGEAGIGESLVGERLDRETSKVGRVLGRGRSARVDSLLDDPDGNQDDARMIGARTGIYAPLIAHDGALGVIVAHDRLGANMRFSDADLRTLEIFAARAAVAVAMSQRVARDTVRRVVLAQEAERRRLALELHDETGQALTSILLGLKSIRAAPNEDAAEEAEAGVRALVVQALQDVRALAVELRPSALDDFGLSAAIERLAQTFEERSGIRTSVDATLNERLPAELETTLYRVVQEALTNVVKHARAEHVSILVARRDGRIAATIEDDGGGFDSDAVREDVLGLVGMRERLALVGGTFTIESTPGSGTTVSAHVPLVAA
jgi:signal transduction histidine kinase